MTADAESPDERYEAMSLLDLARSVQRAEGNLRARLGSILARRLVESGVLTRADPLSVADTGQDDYRAAYLPDAAPAGSEARERVARLVDKHLPVVNARGQVIGCRCSDDVFPTEGRGVDETRYSDHLADLLAALGPAHTPESIAEAAQPLATALVAMWDSGLMGRGKPKEECSEAEMEARHVYSLMHAAQKRLAAALGPADDTRTRVEAWAETWLADWRTQPERQRILELRAALDGSPVDPIATHRAAIATSCDGCGVTAAHCDSLRETEPEHWPCCDDCTHRAALGPADDTRERIEELRSRYESIRDDRDRDRAERSRAARIARELDQALGATGAPDE